MKYDLRLPKSVSDRVRRGLLVPERAPGLKSVMAAAGRITAVGTLVSALEELVRPNDMRDKGLFSWPIRRTSLPILNKQPLARVLRQFEHPTYQRLVVARALAAGTVLISPAGSRTRAVSLAALSALLLAKSYRSTYGSDGSDQMSFITVTVAAAATTPGLEPKHRELLAGFLAFQSTLSYFVAGVAKLGSSTWRDGSAVNGIFRTKTYGDEGLYEFIKDRPWASKGLAWSVIAAETAFPVVLVLPPLPRRCLLALAAVFHVGNARYMGLNRFFWAFLGTYPVVDRASDSLQVLFRNHVRGAQTWHASH